MYVAVLLVPPILSLSVDARILDAVSVICITQLSSAYFDIMSFKNIVLMDFIIFSRVQNALYLLFLTAKYKYFLHINYINILLHI